MVKDEPTSCLKQIGQAAGLVWHALDEHGPQSITKLAKTVDAPRDIVMQAVGWLAREEKIQIHVTKRGRSISLR